jgi:hypothetical protein
MNRDPVQDLTRAALWRSIPGVLVAVLVLIPFRHKAFTIDDHVFMFLAEHATLEPLRPTGFEMVWGDVPGRMGLASGPVMAWLLVPSVVAGGAEWVAHGVQLAMLALAVFGTVALALRLGLAARWATGAGLLLASTPAALAMAGTAMPDVPAMALGVMGVERLVAWRQRRRAHQAVLAVVFLALAPLARPHLVLLLGIGGLLLLADLPETSPPRVRLLDWLPLAAAPVLTGAIAFAVSDPHPAAAGMIAATASVSSLSMKRFGPNAIGFPVHWTLALPLAIPWALLRPRSVAKRWGAFAVAAAAAMILVSRKFRAVWFGAAAGLGVAVLWDIGADAFKRRDFTRLGLALWLLIPLAALPYPHLPPKYLLASAPAAAILVAHELGAAERARARAVLGVVCAAGIALGIGILRADAAFAGLGRRAAAELIAPNVAAGHRVWFAGHWGFQWYAEKAGGRPLTLTAPYPVAGDLVVTSRNSEPGPAILAMLAERYPRKTHLGRIEESGPGGRVMDKKLGAGFYSHAWGYLPWAWGHNVLDTFDLWRID